MVTPEPPDGSTPPPVPDYKTVPVEITEADAVLKGKPIGEILVMLGRITRAQLDEALKLSKQWGTSVGKVLLSQGYIRSYQFYQALAKQLGKRFVDLTKTPPQEWLLRTEDMAEYQRLMVLPWREEDGKVWLVTCRQGADLDEFGARRYGDQFEVAITSQFDLLWTVQKSFGGEMTRVALSSLADTTPKYSAKVVFTRRQILALFLLFSVTLVGLFYRSTPTLIAINAFVALFYLATFGLRTLLSWHGSSHAAEFKIPLADVRALKDAELPAYTVLVPMYKEPEVLPILAAALRKLNYPRAKLDIKLLLEEGDSATIEAAKKLQLESIFEIVRIPPSQPQTKPKACNYGLHFAQGELVTIFDAEDKPEPDQLKKVVLAFRKAPPNVACIQARLNYYNREENWLTRMFTLEYSTWFDLLLPGLEALKIPIPLGGTSNHFRTEVLRDLLAWDPYNMTEDADLGVRMTQRGLTCQVVNATTYEEANTRIGNWIRQRSRWIKGYMQTYLVHMRHPVQLYRSLGPIGFWGFQFFIGGTVACVLLNPVLWLLFAGWATGVLTGLDVYFPPWVVSFSLFNLLVGNAAMIYFFMMGAYKRGYYRLLFYAFTAPAYWALMSIAAYKGFWQLIHKPFYWEKTQHGISKHTPAELAQAAQ
jgi:cellulose synthase/poly-beta-1,6-N-acetylglucosamine synthase-like glycosyltransferase